MISRQTAIDIASEWHSVITWSDPGVTTYSLSSTGRMHSEQHRADLLDYIEGCIGEVIGQPDRIGDYADLLALRHWVANAALAVHVHYDLSVDDLPAACISDCSGSGDATASVERWVGALDFTVNRKRAIQRLTGYGAWDDLENDSDETLAERVLWLACCDFNEYMVWRGDNPDADESECPSGSPVFCLE